MRDLEKYLEDFDQLAFEPIQAGFRRRNFIENLKLLPKFRNVLEVGCGVSSIFEVVRFENNVVVEPIQEFINRLERRTDCENIRFANTTIEDHQTKDKYDLIVTSCILHEVEDPKKFLQSIFNLLEPGGYLYVDVPNARSLHRYFAVLTGFLENIYSTSDTQLNMQQSSAVFDKESLKTILTDCGLAVQTVGGYFLKPFHHARMQELVDRGVFSQIDLESFFDITKEIGDFESEIFAVCRKANN